MNEDEFDMIMEIADSISVFAELEHRSQAFQRAAAEAIESSLKLVRFFRNQGIRSDVVHVVYEKRMAQIRKFRKAMFSKKTDDRIEEVVTLADKTFGGFIFGKILDSLVIGILTFVMLAIFDVSPYNLLIATFVGITNVIPVFGPFIGAIPSFFIVLISNPEKAFLFLVLILIIQQLDGNIIGPKILGDNTGVSSLCVIIAIAICSTLWGVMGMIIGVPIFAVVIELIKRMLEKRLIAKGEPTDTLEY